jgi:two-component system, NarL family, nitrate/nitrite response regulator NarL
MEETLRLLIVADDPLVRAGLAALLADLPACQVIGQVSGPVATADSLTTFEVQPDVIVWDMGWEPADTLPEWRELPWPVVALLADEGDSAAVWAAGAYGLLPRDIDGEKVLAAAQAAVQRLFVLHPGVTATLLPAAQTEDSPDDAILYEELTPRESQVLQLLAEGLTNKAIAQRLSISEHTVKYHVNALMGKLAAQSRTEAVVRATRLGLILL